MISTFPLIQAALFSTGTIFLSLKVLTSTMIIWHYNFGSVNMDTVILSALSITLYMLYRLALKQWSKKQLNETSNWPPQTIGKAELMNGQIPEPWGLPILGHLFFLGDMPHLTLTEWSKKYGEVFQIRLGPRKAVIVCGSDLIHNILVHQGTDIAGRPDFPSFKLVNNGKGMVFNSYSPAWQIKKNLLQKALHNYFRDGQENFQNLLEKQSTKLIGELLNHSGEPFNPANTVGKISSSLFHQILFCNPNVSEEYREKEVAEIVELFQSIMKVSAVTTVCDIFPFLEPLFAKQIQQFRRVNEIIISVVDRQQAQGKLTYSSDNTRDVTDGLASAINSTTEQDLALAHFNGPQGSIEAFRLMGDLLGAGQSTVATSLRWLLLHMAVYPEIQARVREEIISKLPSGASPCPSDESQMPYTTAVILESRRYSVPFPLLVPHATMRDMELNGFKVAKGTVILFNLWSASRDTRVWQEPEQFNPDRFLLPDSRQIDRNARQRFIGFGAGRRRCIGDQVGTSSVFTIFASLMKSCRVSIPDGESVSLRGSFGFSLEAEPYNLIIEPVE